jgi:hypothetical protein
VNVTEAMLYIMREVRAVRSTLRWEGRSSTFDGKTWTPDSWAAERLWEYITAPRKK